MRKLKLLFTGFAFLGGVFSANAQTDVTSTYLTNADFSETTPITGTYLYGYGKDGSPYGYQAVDGWTSVVTSGDNSNASYPNSGTAAAVFSYGSSTQLKGNSKAAPATNPDGEASGNCFGFFGVWGCGGYYYQNVTLAAGKYTITVPMYSQSGTQANTTYTGFFPTSGTNRTVAVNPKVGEWVNQSVTFTLTDDTEGQIRIGYQSTDNGSGANPMLFIDCVKIEFTAIVVKDVLETALTAATKANAVLSNSDLAAAIATAQAVYDNEDATQDEVNAAAATLNAATELAMSAAGDVTGIFLSNPGFESCDVTTTNAAATGSAAPLDISGNWTQVSSAAWSSSAVVAYGGSGQVNGVSAPDSDNAGNSGNAFGVSVGWDGLVTYQSDAVTLPAGVYTLEVYAFNANSGATQFSSKFGFVPTEGAPSLSTKTSFTYNSWETDQVSFTLNEAAEGKIQIGGKAVSGGSGSNAKVFLDNITITYRSFLDGAKAAWDEAKAKAEAAIDDEAYENVTGSERTALETEIAKAEPTTAEGYDEAAAALNAATATFTAAKAAYDGLASLWSASVPELIYAATEKYTAIGDAYFGEGDVVDAVDAAARTEAMITAIRAYYESHALAEGVEGAVNKTDLLTNYNDPTNIAGWTINNTVGNSNMRTMSSESYTDADGTNNHSYFDSNSWGSAFSSTFTQDVELPAGTYILTVKARGNNTTTYQVVADGMTTDITPIGNTGGVFDRGWNDYTVEFTLTAKKTVTLGINMETGNSGNWLSFGDFRLVRIAFTPATSTEYNSLNEAKVAAEAKTLGFEKDEYAPYNNVDGLVALANAKALNQSEENAKADVEALTEALSEATWTPNNANVDAIYNGMFTTVAEGQNYPDGWTRTNSWGQMRSEIEGDYATAYYNQPGSLQYGNQGVYTMPLAENTIYKLTFAYRSHENNSNNGMTVSVLNGEDGLVATTFAGNGSTSEWKVVSQRFKTGAAGNYVLTLANSGNTWITNVSLVKSAADEVEIDEDDDYTSEVSDYADVTLTRTFKAGKWNTFVVPFDIDNDELVDKFGDAVEVAEYSEVADGENSTVSFDKMDIPAITANTPVLLKTSTDNTSFVFTGKQIKTGEAKVAGNANFDFVGTYAATLTIDEGDYFISDNKLWKAEANKTTIKGTRAYIKAKKDADARIVNFFIDGQETTGISTITTQKFDNAAYDMQGRRVETLKKGVYVVNGKKVVVK